jgi:hypothetical protein
MLNREEIFEAMRLNRMQSLISRGRAFNSPPSAIKGGIRPNVSSGGGEPEGSLRTEWFNSEYAMIGARNTDFEFAVGSGKSIAFWFKPNNIRLGLQKFISVSNGTFSQYYLQMLPIDDAAFCRLRWRMLSIANLSAGYMQRQTVLRLLRERWYFIVMTYSGSQLNTGMQLYVNAVESSSGSANSSFNQVYSDAGLRPYFGQGGVASQEYADCSIAHYQIYNKALSAGEVTTLYNSGVTASDYSLNALYLSNGVRYFPMSSLTDKTGTITLTTTNGAAITTEPANINTKKLGFRITNYTPLSRYVAFGSFIRINSDSYYWMGRSGTDHLGGGKCLKYPITPSLFDSEAGISGNKTTYIIDEGSTVDFRGGGGGYFNGKIFFASATYTSQTDTFEGAYIYESTDGSTGNAFTRQDMGMPTYTGGSGYNFYGKIIAGFAAGELFAPFYEHDNGGTWIVSFYKTTNYGADGWPTKVTVFNNNAGAGGLPSLGETAIINLGSTSAGSQTLLAISRKEGSPYGLWQMVSGNAGATWTTPVLTNLAETIVTTGARSNAEMCLDDSGNIDIVFMTRENASTSGKTYLSKGNVPNTIIANPLAWNTKEIIFNGHLGYPSIENLGGNNRLVATCIDANGGADVMIGIGSIY